MSITSSYAEVMWDYYTKSHKLNQMHEANDEKGYLKVYCAIVLSWLHKQLIIMCTSFKAFEENEMKLT